MNPMRHQTGVSGTPPRTPSKLRWLGVFWALLGIVAMATTFAATLATMLVFGIFLLIAGIAQLIHAAFHASADRGWEFLTAAIYSLVGVLLIFDPVGGAIGLTLLIAILFLGRGTVQLAMAISGRHRRRRIGWQLAAGLVNLLLAMFIIAGWPQVGTWIIGLFVGIELLIGGLVMLLTPEALDHTEIF